MKYFSFGVLALRSSQKTEAFITLFFRGVLCLFCLVGFAFVLVGWFCFSFQLVLFCGFFVFCLFAWVRLGWVFLVCVFVCLVV